jgi:cell division protein FtsI (penicillin-binding protein 3)
MATRMRSSARVLCLLGVLIAGSAAIAGRLFWLQIVASDRFDELAAVQRERTIMLAAQRGSIMARDGSELAISMDMQTVYASPRSIPHPRQAAAALAPVLKVDRTTLESKLSADSGFVYLARRIDPAIAQRVKQLRIPGVELIAEPKRFYPSGRLASQVLGFVGNDNQGLGGLEVRYDELLRGTPGRMITERDPSGRLIPSGKSFLKRPVQGDDLILTLDKQIQFEAEAALDRARKAWGVQGGTVIVMDPDNGAILAMANFPTFDPNNIKNSAAASRKNRGAVDVYEFGSVNKLITGAAALESGVVSSGDLMSIPDHMRIGSKVFRDSHPHPTQTLSFAQVIERSSNIGTIRVGERLGKQRLYEYLSRFGYGSRTGLDFPGQSVGILPKPEKWWATSLGTISIGQGVAVTPLHLTKAYATVANDGVEVQPNLVLGTVDASGRRHRPEPPRARRVIKSTTAEELTEILLRVTESEHGTGRAAAIPGYRVAGKTGTAQKPRQGVPGYTGYVSSFVGFAPAEDPQLVVGVILDDPDLMYAGSTAAITFREVMQFSLRRLGVSPGAVTDPSGVSLVARVTP